MMVSAISSVGFPIVCCGFMAYFIMTTLKDLQNTIQANTSVMDKILGVLSNDKGENDHDVEI